MGSVNNRDEKLYFDFRYQGKRCKEYTKLPDTPDNRKRCQKILDHIEAEMLLGLFEYGKYFPKSKKVDLFHLTDQKRHAATADTPLFKDFCEVWYKENEIVWRKNHRKTIRGHLDRDLIPVFSEKHIGDIQKADILDFRATIAKRPGQGNTTLSPETINHIMAPLRMIFREGSDRYGFQNPYRNIKSLKVPKTDVHPFTLDEVFLFVKSVRPDFKTYYLSRFLTGMRGAEIDGLQWRYVDFDRRQILIRKTWVKGEQSDTKNDGSLREIHMSEMVYKALLKQHKITGSMQFVFCNRAGNPLSNSNVRRRVWYPTLKLLGLLPRKPYQTRHTAATLWLASGENPEWICRQMGHTSTEMLFKVYSRYVPNLTRQDGSAFEQLLSGKES